MLILFVHVVVWQPCLLLGAGSNYCYCTGSNSQNHGSAVSIQLFLLLLLKEVGSARLRESDIHPISPKTPAPQYQPIDRKKRKEKKVQDYSRDRAA